MNGRGGAFRLRICKELLPVCDTCPGFDLSDLDAFIQKATEAEMAALKADDAVLNARHSFLPRRQLALSRSRIVSVRGCGSIGKTQKSALMYISYKL